MADRSSTLVAAGNTLMKPKVPAPKMKLIEKDMTGYQLKCHSFALCRIIKLKLVINLFFARLRSRGIAFKVSRKELTSYQFE